MKKMTSQEIRQTWLDYFKNNDHFEVESASLIPINDNSLLWINSGVATLKKYFSGKENPPHPNLTNSQKSIRTNDIFNVGVTSRHHTFFEMLGNFSVGGYFKEKAIELAFNLLIKEFEISLDDLYFTVFEEDQLAYDTWVKLGVNPNRILKCGRDRNFWDVGSGPCGPCTEIHYDRGPKYDPKGIGEKLFFEDIENDRYVEIWNIVFSEFNNDGNNNYTPLKRKNIDTGAGLERIACISQDVPTNFDTDLFQSVIQKIQTRSKHKYDMQAYFGNDAKQHKINLAYKVIADHARASVFAIADGAIPSNKERGYILRRLIRRLVVKCHTLEIDENIFVDIVDAIIEVMKGYYPYLIEQRDKVIAVLNKEYDIFKKTLDQGFKLYKESIDTKKKTIAPEIVFKLVETYGFPIELIKELADDDGLTIDEDKFNELFKHHQEISRSRQNEIAMSTQNGELLNLDTPFKFHYDKTQMDATIMKLYDEDFNPISELTGDGFVVLDNSCIYATSGGQLHDTGLIKGFEVDNAIKGPNLQHIHHVRGSEGLKTGETVKVSHDEHRRSLLMKNHSVEHLIHATLGKLVDKNIKQEGAFKSPEKVTFDFQYHEKLSPQKLKEIEAEINQIIKQAIDVSVLEVTLEEAQELGAKAYFEDVYKKVKGKLRMIKMGDVSTELCGGTHVHNTNDIEIFKIVDFHSRAAGSWRIEAITSFETVNTYIASKKESIKKEITKMQQAPFANDELNNKLSSIDFNADVTDIIAQFNSVVEVYKALKMDYDKANAKNQIAEIKKLLSQDGKLVIIEGTDWDNKNVFNALTEIINEKQETIFAAFNQVEDKIQYMLATNAKNKINLNETIKELNSFANGKGGGKPNFVQGGCSSSINKNDLIKIVKDKLG